MNDNAVVFASSLSYIFKVQSHHQLFIGFLIIQWAVTDLVGY